MDNNGNQMSLEDFKRKYSRTFPFRDLGRGHLGYVRKHKNNQTGTYVAVKVTQLSTADRYEVDSLRDRARIEFNIYKTLQWNPSTRTYDGGHEHIIKLYGMYWDGGRSDYKLVLELGHEVLRKRFKELKRTLSELETRPIIEQLAQGLTFLHSKDIVHRDLKMCNILCMSANSLTPVKICDLEGGHQSIANKPLTPLREPAGTAHIVEPVIAQNMVTRRSNPRAYGNQLKPYNRRCDVYSLGTIMYKLLTKADMFNSVACKEHWRNLTVIGDFIVNVNWRRCADCLDAVIDNTAVAQFDIDKSFIKPNASPACKDLLTQMLDNDSSRRIHANQIEHHDWFHLPLTDPESMCASGGPELSYPDSDDERSVCVVM